MKRQKKKTYDRGMKAEGLAALWLQVKGYKILARRYKTPVGEIDLIVQKNNLIAFVEVKSRMTTTQALESLTPSMRRRIERAAAHYIGHNNCEGRELRFDLVTVAPPFFIQHLDNAWLQAA
ncbi:MAG TPA: YraN family protein [Alphaproteobacteria bacterium]|nr:YraN family protein [Alphaproteobacteria bacterium]